MTYPATASETPEDALLRFSSESLGQEAHVNMTGALNFEHWRGSRVHVQNMMGANWGSTGDYWALQDPKGPLPTMGPQYVSADIDENLAGQLAGMIENFRSAITGAATPDRCPRCDVEHSIKALSNTLELERTAISFDRTAGAILGRIFDRGHATFADLADWLETEEEWIAFSRLQRARLLYDSGEEFTVSREGRSLVRRLLGEGDIE